MKNKELTKLIVELKELAIMEHFSFDDAWYNCPLSSEGCPDKNKISTKCYCEAEEHNMKVEKIFQQIKGLL